VKTQNNDAMKIPQVPFDICFEHNDSRQDGVCADIQPADNVASGALRLYVQTRRTIGTFGDERVVLVNSRNERCAVNWENPSTSMSTGCTHIEFVASIPDGWFD
jgi:hypothetical protein